MKHHAFCPKCGADVSLDEPRRIDDFSMVGAGYPLLYRGEEVGLTPFERELAWSIMKAFPAHVSGDTLLQRSDADLQENSLKVYICRIRQRVREVGGPDPLETVRGLGYRWRPGGGHAIAERVAADAGSVTEILNSIYNTPRSD